MNITTPESLTVVKEEKMLDTSSRLVDQFIVSTTYLQRTMSQTESLGPIGMSIETFSGDNLVCDLRITWEMTFF